MIIETTTYDLETNGLKNTSVLGFTQISHLYDSTNNTFTPLSHMTRWYVRREGELMNFDALRVNRLYDNVIERNRKNTNAKYPLLFDDDLENLLKYFSKECIIGHNNISFDNSFMKDGFNKKAVMIDTMVLNRDIIKLPSRGSRALYKNPKLIEAAEYYNVNTEDKDFHTSEDDVLMTFDIFKKMLLHSEAKTVIENEIKNIMTIKNSRQIIQYKDMQKRDLGNGTIFHYGKLANGIEHDRKFVWNVNGVNKFSGKDFASHLFGFNRFTKEITSDFNRFSENIKNNDTLTAFIDRININYNSIPEDFCGIISYNSADIFSYDISRKYFYEFLSKKFKGAKLLDLCLK